MMDGELTWIFCHIPTLSTFQAGLTQLQIHDQLMQQTTAKINNVIQFK